MKSRSMKKAEEEAEISKPENKSKKKILINLPKPKKPAFPFNDGLELSFGRKSPKKSSSKSRKKSREASYTQTQKIVFPENEEE